MKIVISLLSKVADVIAMVEDVKATQGVCVIGRCIAIPSIFMPYIEGPKMDWIVNDDLYHRFLKWRLKCKKKNIQECELAMLAERRKCKKVIAWSGDFGIDQYVSWNLTNEERTLDVI